MEGLPKILCLHGSGSSGPVFKIQTRAIQRALKGHFEFVFVNAPFPSSIGPGMYPTFSDSGPFYRWHCEASAGHLGISDEEAEAEREIVRRRLGETVSEATGAPFVGIMAFSQGCGVATGLLLDQYRLGREWGECPSFQFGLLFCGTYPPLLLKPDPNSGTCRVNLPSLHVVGIRDPYVKESKKLLTESYATGTGRCIEFQGGHHIPSGKRELDEITKAVLVMAESVQVM